MIENFFKQVKVDNSFFIKAADQIVAWNAKARGGVTPEFTQEMFEAQLSFVREELKEFQAAAQENDHVELLDAAADIFVVASYLAFMFFGKEGVDKALEMPTGDVLAENIYDVIIEFDKMPSISIDYAIMEKSDKIALVKLESDWNDLGSWQSIYDVSKKDEHGNVFIGHVLDKESKNSFVYASSKLVATIGLEDTVIVETEDAILACKKDRTQDVKYIFDTLKKQNDNTHLVHKTVYRPWGFYTVIAQGDGFLTKIIHVNPGQKLSVQSHNFRSEHWVILSGTAKVVLEGKELILSPGHSVDIPLKAIHSLQNPYSEDVEVIEVQKGDPLIEEDIIRYEDMYGRV